MESLDLESLDLESLDLEKLSVRQLNHTLHHEIGPKSRSRVEILNPNGLHNIAVGLDAPLRVDVRGHAGYFLGGMNRQAQIVVHGNVGWSVGENMMSGEVRVKGFASQCAGASAHGGLLFIEGSASSRCGISLKGGDIVVGGHVGHMSAFMAQAGHLVICGDAGAGLGDSLYEAVIYVRGRIHSLGRRCPGRAHGRKRLQQGWATAEPDGAGLFPPGIQAGGLRQDALSLERGCRSGLLSGAD